MTKTGLLELATGAMVRGVNSEGSMATMTITEYAGDGVSLSKPLVHQTILTYTTSAQSAAFGARTKKIRCQASAAVHVLVGANPTATANHPRYGAGVEFELDVEPAQKIAAYDGSS